MWSAVRRCAGRLPVGQDCSLPTQGYGPLWPGGRGVLRPGTVRQPLDGALGWAVAYRQYTTAFIADEADARQQRRNLWQGPFQMPADYRRGKREEARQARAVVPLVSGSCRIKGNISRQGKKIYHVPGQRDYERTSIDLSRGERMFCRPEEAARAGWHPAKR